MIDENLFKKKELYPYQQAAVDKILDSVIERSDENLLFQLPTGGGKTVIFSEVAYQFIERTGRKVLILTHRIELSVQTAKQLQARGINNKVINSEVKEIEDRDKYQSYTAMVETLNNRLTENKDFVDNVGLVIVDEAHYNSFRKLFQFFDNATILGVTATPLSSNKALPLKDNYDNLLVGESIKSLIEGRYLSDADTFSYDVNLKGLKIGINGDFTVSSSEVLYANYFMQEKLLFAYEEAAFNTKTLIFNPGIESSLRVAETFQKKDYPAKHLDSTFSDKERKEVVQWFRDTPNAILSSVGILTTGFDEPSVETIVLNRATRSLTLYHQMIGRGSRRTPTKDKFQIIDLGNNVRRFGIWQDYIDWNTAFKFPDRFLESQLSEEDDLEFEVEYEIHPDIKKAFEDVSELTGFHTPTEYKNLVDKGEKGRDVIDLSINNHADFIIKNAGDFYDGLDYLKVIDSDIDHRIKQYTKCISKSTDNYQKYIKETYLRKVRLKLREELEDE